MDKKIKCPNFLVVNAHGEYLEWLSESGCTSHWTTERTKAMSFSRREAIRMLTKFGGQYHKIEPVWKEVA